MVEMKGRVCVCERKMCECLFLGGELRDAYLYSILGEEWKEPTLTDENRLKIFSF